jgi:hypothetical protein
MSQEIQLIGDWEYLGRDQDNTKVLLLRCHYCGIEKKAQRGDLVKGLGVFCLICQKRRRKEATESVKHLAPDCHAGRSINRKVRKSKTGYTGVYFQPLSGNYFASIRVNGVTQHLGSFSSAEIAATEREKAKKNRTKQR